MILLYVDESGHAEDSADHFVVGGLAVHEADIDELRRRADGVMRKYLDPHLLALELHAHSIRTGGGSWRGIARQPKASILGDMSKLLGARSSKRGYGLFAVVRAPGAVPSADPLQRSFEELLLRFNAFLLRRDSLGLRDFGLVVADRAKYEGILQPIVTRWRTAGTRFGRLRRLAEVPLFADSRASRLIQLADLVAHGVYRNYAAGDSSIFAPMLPAFDANSGVMHGLVHLVRNYRTCPCPACVSRAVLAKMESAR